MRGMRPTRRAYGLAWLGIAMIMAYAIVENARY
jgi:hypothetical protein